MLDAYVAQTQRLLQNPQATTALYSTTDIVTWINIARGQMAGEAECIRRIATLPTVASQSAYNFSAITLPGGSSATTGLDGVINVRSMAYVLNTGQKFVPPRPWEWFNQYTLNNPAPVAGPPTVWSQYGQGAAPGDTGALSGGSLYINLPDDVYTLNLDCVCYPIPLVDDSTVEALPYLWTDAVPFFAACYALWSAQTNARMADAERYFNTYVMFVERARKASNPSVGRWQYAQALDPVQAGKLGMKAAAGGG